MYSVPAFDSEWYPRNMYIEGSKVYEHHIKTYGAHKDFGYKDFIPMFKAEKFDPNAWAALFKKAGAKYVVPVAEHHDGFQMYRSNISHWNAYEMGPKRDIVGELKAAVEAQGMTLGVSSHRIEHWFFMSNGKKFESDMPQNPDRDDLYWPSMPDPENFDAIDGKPNTTPICETCARRSFHGTRPSMTQVPLSGVKMPERILMVLLFPAPFGPI